ncbi:hypothetical protein V1478_010749 [Vespula squamosa]|uniref:Secreted protein n=1 Tax=Vespula squamosa TaxID=30214 RepID=A0ABD2AG69_VESSQ
MLTNQRRVVCCCVVIGSSLFYPYLRWRRSMRFHLEWRCTAACCEHLESNMLVMGWGSVDVFCLFARDQRRPFLYSSHISAWPRSCHFYLQ